MGWHPLDERLSNRKDTLDGALTDLGISPHPRVLLALEGEAEVYHARSSGARSATRRHRNSSEYSNSAASVRTCRRWPH